MEREELDAYIDQNITNKTAAASISPIDEGNTFKKVADYVDEQQAGTVSQTVKVMKTTITTEEVLTLFDTPITVLDGSAEGKVMIPINIWIKRNAGTAYTLASTTFLLINDSGLPLSGNINSTPLTSDEVGFFTTGITYTSNVIGIDKNNLFKLKANTGNPTLGTGNLDVYLTYIEITL